MLLGDVIYLDIDDFFAADVPRVAYLYQLTQCVGTLSC